jgi:hypothetical protein
MGGQKRVLWVKGMNEPADGAMNLVKTSNGWKAN